MARQALSVLEELATELTADVTYWLCPGRCRGSGQGEEKEAVAVGRKPPSSRSVLSALLSHPCSPRPE